MGDQKNYGALFSACVIFLTRISHEYDDVTFSLKKTSHSHEIPKNRAQKYPLLISFEIPETSILYQKLKSEQRNT